MYAKIHSDSVTTDRDRVQWTLGWRASAFALDVMYGTIEWLFMASLNNTTGLPIQLLGKRLLG